MVKIFWWRLSFLLLFCTLQFSVATLLFPQSAVPGFLLNVAMVLVLVRGFRASAWEWLFLFFVFDILRMGTITLFTPAGIFFCYLTSFISRRFLFEHRGTSLFLLSLLSGAGAVSYSLFLSFFEKRELLLLGIISDFVLACLTFVPLFLLVQWFERRLETTREAEFRGLRP